MTRSKAKPRKQFNPNQKSNSWSLRNQTIELLKSNHEQELASKSLTKAKKYGLNNIPTSYRLLENTGHVFIKCLKLSFSNEKSPTSCEVHGMKYIIILNENLYTLCFQHHLVDEHKYGKCAYCIEFTLIDQAVSFSMLLNAVENDFMVLQLHKGSINLLINFDKGHTLSNANNKSKRMEVLLLYKILHQLGCITSDKDEDNTLQTFSSVHNAKNLQETFRNLLEKNKAFTLKYKNQMSIEHTSMLAILRKYQTQAVMWMLEKERTVNDNKIEYTFPCSLILDEKKKVVGYINTEIGFVSSSFVAQEIVVNKCNKGGILADEMGLGKTVETLGCILLNPRTDYRNFNLNYTAIYLENKEYISELYSTLPEIVSTRRTNPKCIVNDAKKHVVTLTDIKRFSICQGEFINTQDLILNALHKTKTKVKSNCLLQSTCRLIPNCKITVKKNNFETALKSLIEKGFINITYSSQRVKQIKYYGIKKAILNSYLPNLEKKIENFKQAYDIYLLQLNYLKDDNRIPTDTPAKLEHDLHCICGENGHNQEENPIIQCACCQTYQHKKCIKYFYFFKEYLCPHCAVLEKNVIKCKGTLIISPLAIYEQWMSEINLHVKPGGLNVFCYKGMKSLGYVQPYVLSQYDVVIATYATLKTELYNTNLPHHGDSKLRKKKVYMATPSPLLALQWWRVCLDESQMIGSAAANASKMAALLPSMNRWCITGTPISNDLDDLYGQICFLNVSPLTDKPLWNKLIALPFANGDCEPLLKILELVMWRNTKLNVSDELNLPPLVEVEHVLTNSNIEKYFYKKVHDICKTDVLNSLFKNQTVTQQKLENSDEHLSPFQLGKVVNSLKRLRQACCDPSITNYFGNVTRYNININRCITMDILLDNLIKKCINECEESLRQCNAARNGLAGVFILENKAEEAIEMYRQTLKISSNLKEQVRTDPLQTLHAAYNLNQMLKFEPTRYGRTLRDDDLENMCKEIEVTYAKRHVDIVNTKHQQFESTKLSCSMCISNPYYKSSWWDKVIKCAVDIGNHDELLRGINASISAIKTCSVFATTGNFSTFYSLSFVLSKEVDALFAASDALTSLMQKLFDKQNDQSFQSAASLCHLRPIDGNMRGTCELCTAETDFNAVESKLFSPGTFSTAAMESASSTTTGLKARGYGETILMVILSFAKRHKTIQPMADLVQYGDVHLEMFDKMKKLYNVMHGLWSALRDNVAAVDELKMAKTRLQLANNLSEFDQSTAMNIVYKSELSSTKLSCQTDLNFAKEMLNTRLGQLRYLKNLARFEKQNESIEKNGETVSQDQCNNNLHDCPICTNEFGLYWVMHQCGHCYCVKCNERLIKLNANSQQVQCAVCRSRTSIKDISYVTSRKETIGENDVPVIGNNSTKVTGVIRQLLQLSNAKVLLFSTWQKMLDILSEALAINKIKHKLVTSPSSKTFTENLNEFKNPLSGFNVLLMPINIGGKGLNIVEANHVFLVEPILSKAVELQAIGRVHRLGQTQETTVHKFYIKETIEEKLYELTKKFYSKSFYSSESVKNASDEKMLAEISLGEIKEIFC